MYVLYFKFQSDSINTIQSCMVMVMITTLNSNLILLILLNSNYIKYAEFTLNSNLILLILTAAFEHYGFDVVFKFQSDSINTQFLCPV